MIQSDAFLNQKRFGQMKFHLITNTAIEPTHTFKMFSFLNNFYSNILPVAAVHSNEEGELFYRLRWKMKTVEETEGEEF